MPYIQHNSPFFAKSKPPAPSKKKSLGYYNKANPTGTGTDAGGGMSEKGVKKYRRDNPGSKLQTAVTKDPSKIKAGSKGGASGQWSARKAQLLASEYKKQVAAISRDYICTICILRCKCNR